MSTQQATLDSGHFGTNDSSDYNCPLCGANIRKLNLSTHLSSDECDSEHKEVNYEY